MGAVSTRNPHPSRNRNAVTDCPTTLGTVVAPPFRSLAPALKRPELFLLLVMVQPLFAGVGANESWLPTRRAARVDPIIAMRSD
jgi:hypothetical protein